MISVYDSKCTGLGFNNNGLVILKDCISALVPEQLNGTYELELEHPLDIEGRWKYLVEDNIIRADGQLFRIYHKVTTLTSRTINARHIFYDQIDNYVEGATITGTANDAMAYISTHKQYADEFTLSSDLVDSNKLILPSANPVELIMGTEGLITTLGGELMRDNFDSKLLINRGSNKNVLISYGKNIKGIKEDIDLDVVATRLNVVGTNSEKKIYLPEKYIDSPLINNYSHPKTRSLTLPMDIIQYTVTAAVTTAISVYKSASVINNASFAGDVADTKIIASISGKERIEASEKVSLNTIWQAIHTDYNIKYNYALPWFDEPTATYALLDDLKTAIPKGNDNIYEVTNIDTVNGQKWYYWTSFAWEETERIDKQLDNYTTAYNMLKAYLDPILATMSTPTNIHSTDMKAKFKTYYTDRSIITTAVFNKTINSLWKIRSKANYDSYIVKLRQMATDYFKTSECDIPHPNYTIDFVELSKTEEYKNYKVLQGVELGDTVIVRHVKLGIDLQLEVIKTTKNILTGNLDVVELGSLKPTLSTSFTNTDQAIQAISTRVSSLENNSAKVVDGVIINGTIDFDKINAMESLYNQLTNADSNADIYVDSITGRLATFDELVAGNITAVNIKTGSLTADTITAGTITANEMKVGTITAESGILDMASIGAAIIDNAVIGTTQIADGSITDAKIVSLTAEKIVSGTVDTSKVTILGPNGNLRIANSRLQVFDSSETPIERVSIGDVNGDQTEYGLRVRGADGTTILLDENGVRNEGITDGAIDNSKISADADINGTKLLSNSITGGKLVIDAITAREIASKTITANEILAGTITANEIAAGTITASKIKVGELVVGVNVTMGAGAIISWSNLSAESQTNLTGTDGTNGTNRTSGTNGATGATGSQGYTGSTGSTGPQGNTGSTGPTGPTGPAGSDANVPAYITSTGITQTTISSPTITGGSIIGALVQQKYGSVVVNEFTKNSYGGVINQYDNAGNLNVTLGVESGLGTNVGGSLTTYLDGYKNMAEMGAAKSTSSGFVSLFDVNGNMRAELDALNNGFASVILRDAAGTAVSYLREDGGVIAGDQILRGGNPRSTFSTSTAIQPGGSMAITHNLGYSPIVVLSGTTGTVILTYHSTNTVTTVFNSSTSISAWSGTMQFF